ncbi:hypothetical protein, conserved [Plasmodium vivax]|uniref:Calponin homology domain-containing protein n=1 Tax=Plasmodium vivax (strain Salvador I) TaxID=126793 RepID=A5K3T3_PLAVS|nr:hypothetical protein, conserved [Plasmodium vivax]EDL46187.1 hypothetical protein, conserved [Plasmodium vivax]|eukprot:XP_001615914.1 hypothetical protein [Plasmodium vivax Sal-1]
MEKNNAIGKEQLVCWVKKLLKRNHFHFGELKDGGVYVELLQCIWPQMVKRYEERYQHRGEYEEKEKTNWRVIHSTLKDLNIDSDFISYNQICEGHFSSCYQSLILLFFLHSLVKHHECDFVLAYPVTKRLTDFMSSEEPLNCLVRAGSVQLPQKFFKNVSNCFQVNNSTVMDGKRRDSPLEVEKPQNCVFARSAYQSHHSDFSNGLNNSHPHRVNEKKSTSLSSPELVPSSADGCAAKRDKSYTCRGDSLLSLVSGTSTATGSSGGGNHPRDTPERGSSTTGGAAYQGRAPPINSVDKKRTDETAIGEKPLNKEGSNEPPIRSNAPYSFDQMVTQPRSNFFKYFNKTDVGKSEILEKAPHEDRKSVSPEAPHLNVPPPPTTSSSSCADEHKPIRADVKETKVDASCQAENDPFFNFLLNHDSVENLKVTWNDEEKNVKGESFIWFLKTQVKMYKRELRLREEELELTSQMKKKEMEDLKMVHSVELAMLQEKHQAQIFYLKQQHLEGEAKMRKQFEAKISNMEEDLTLDLDVLHCQERGSLLGSLPGEEEEWAKGDEERSTSTQGHKHRPKHGCGRQYGGDATQGEDTLVDHDEEDANINRFLFDQVDVVSVLGGETPGGDHYRDDIPKKKKFLNFDYCLENGAVREAPKGAPEGEDHRAMYTETAAELTANTNSNIREAINKMRQLVSKKNMEHEINNKCLRGEMEILRNAVENFKSRRASESDLVKESAQVVSELLQSIDREQEGEEVPPKGWNIFTYVEKEQSKIYEMIKKGHNGPLKSDEVVKILDGSSLIRLLVRVVCALKLERVKRRLGGERATSKESERRSERRGEPGASCTFLPNDTPSNEIKTIEREMETAEHIKRVERKNKRLQCLNEYYKKRLGHLEVWTHALENLKSRCKQFYTESGTHAFTSGGEERALHECAVVPSGGPSDEASSSEQLSYERLSHERLSHERLSHERLSTTQLTPARLAPKSASTQPSAALPPFLWSPEFYLRSFAEENERDAELMRLLKLLGRCENEEDVLLFQSDTPVRCGRSDREEESSKRVEEDERQPHPDKLMLSVRPNEAWLKKKLTHNFWLMLGDIYSYRNVIVEACHYICQSNSMMSRYITTSEQKMREERRQFENACNGKDTVHRAEKYKWRQLIGTATFNRDLYKEKYMQLQRENQKEKKNLLHLTNLCYEQESVKYRNTILKLRQADHNYRVYKAREKKWVQLAKLLITELTNSSKGNQEEVKDAWLEIVAAEKEKEKKRGRKKKCLQVGDPNWESHIEEGTSNDACARVVAGTALLTPIGQNTKEAASLGGTDQGGENQLGKGSSTSCTRGHIGPHTRGGTTIRSSTTNRCSSNNRCGSNNLGAPSKGGRKSAHRGGSHNMHRQDSSMCKQASPTGWGAKRTSAEQDEGGSEPNRSRDYFTEGHADYYVKDFHTFLNDVQSSCVLNFSSASEADIWASEGGESGVESGRESGSDVRLATSKNAIQTAVQMANNNADHGVEAWETRLKQMAEESCAMFQRVLGMKEEEIKEWKKQTGHLEGELNEMKKQNQSQQNKYACLKEQQSDLVKRLGSLSDIISDLNDQMYQLKREKIDSENRSLTKQQHLHTLVRNYECTIKLIKSHLKKYPSVLYLVDTVTDEDKGVILELASAGEKYNAGESYKEGLSFSLQEDKHTHVKAKQNCVIKSVARETATNEGSQVWANLEEANMSIGGEDKSEGSPDFSLTDLMRDMGWDT